MPVPPSDDNETARRQVAESDQWMVPIAPPASTSVRMLLMKLDAGA